MSLSRFSRPAGATARRPGRNGTGTTVRPDGTVVRRPGVSVSAPAPAEQGDQFGDRFEAGDDLLGGRSDRPDEAVAQPAELRPSALPSESLDDLPPALSSMWRLCKLGYRHQPGLMLLSFFLSLLAALPDALLAFWLALLANGAMQGDTGQVRFAALALGVTVAGTWLLRTVSARVQRRFRDRVTIALEAHVASLQASIATIAHQERPEYLDRLAVLRNQVFVLDHMYTSVFSICGWIVRLGITIALLAAVHPLLVLLAVFALPTVATSAWRPAVERKAYERGAQAQRLARHLFSLATSAASAKEVRVMGIGERLIVERRAAWERWYALVSAARWDSAVWNVLAWTLFGLAYVAAAIFVASTLGRSPGEVLLVLAAGSRLAAYVGATVGEISFLRGIWMDGAQRLAWLEEYAASLTARADLPVPTHLDRGIRFEHVSFAYPGTERLVLDDVSLDLPAGAVVAVVGENGAGKSTLVKLLGKLYEPTAGTIFVDDVPLDRLPVAAWRERLAGAFQDFFRFEFLARHSVGLGDLPRFDDERAAATAVERAGAVDDITRLPFGLKTQLGATWADGTDLSFGQWQKIALARGFMRDDPLLLVLDEPTAALDAETEHALFERYAAATRFGSGQRGNQVDELAFWKTIANGRITILVSHRFSTVRMADLIVVLDGARVAEVGTHEELLARGGQYAELYGLQAAAYR